MEIAVKDPERVTDTVPNQHKSEQYMPTLDGLRGIACFLVFIAHLVPINGLGLQDTREPIIYGLGCLGVILFFSLSGFLMGKLYLNRHFGLDNSLKFLVARFARIAPAYYIAVTFVIILLLTVMPDYPYMSKMDTVMAIRSYLFIGSAGVFWSIPPEIQFYVYFLFLWGGYFLFTKGVRWPLMLLILVSLALIATRDHWGGILLPSKLHIFLLGVGAAYFSSFTKVARLATRPLVQIAVTGLAISYYAYLVSTTYDWPKADLLAKHIYYSDIFLAFLIAAMVMVLSTATVMTRMLGTRAMVLIGGASFSIYLFHEPVLRLLEKYVFSNGYSLAVNFPLAILLGLGLPILFHLACERSLNRSVREKGLKTVFALKDRIAYRLDKRST